MLDISRLEVPPAGFGNCGQCAYRDVGTGGICFACASQEMEPLAENRCEVCDLELGPWGRCENPVCNFTDRGFTYVWAISMMTGRLRGAILRYKYDGVRAWASIFGRVLAGYLDDNAPAFERFDLIVPSPTFIGPGPLGAGTTSTRSLGSPPPSRRRPGPSMTATLTRSSRQPQPNPS